MLRYGRKQWVYVLGGLMLLGLVGCSSGQSEESQPESISSAASQAETESSGEAVTILESASESEESEPETEPRTEEERSSAAEETSTEAEAQETVARETEPSVEPVYFEGDEQEVIKQKLALGGDNAYCHAVTNFFEDQGVTDISSIFDYMFATDSQYYSEEDFDGYSDTILNLAKNEIYARRGRMFTDPELYEFFLTRMWYEPKYTPEEFDEGVFNEYERANLDLLVSLGA